MQQWVAMYREVVAAVDELRIKRQAEQSIREAMQQESQGGGGGAGNWVDVPEVLTMIHDKVWLAKRQERHVLEQIQQTGATTKILRIKKASKLVQLMGHHDTNSGHGG